MRLFITILETSLSPAPKIQLFADPNGFSSDLKRLIEREFSLLRPSSPQIFLSAVQDSQGFALPSGVSLASLVTEGDHLFAVAEGETALSPSPSSSSLEELVGRFEASGLALAAGLVGLDPARSQLCPKRAAKALRSVLPVGAFGAEACGTALQRFLRRAIAAWPGVASGFAELAGAPGMLAMLGRLWLAEEKEFLPLAMENLAGLAAAEKTRSALARAGLGDLALPLLDEGRPERHRAALRLLAALNPRGEKEGKENFRQRGKAVEDSLDRELGGGFDFSTGKREVKAFQGASIGEISHFGKYEGVAGGSRRKFGGVEERKRLGSGDVADRGVEASRGGRVEGTDLMANRDSREAEGLRGYDTRTSWGVQGQEIRCRDQSTPGRSLPGAEALRGLDSMDPAPVTDYISVLSPSSPPTLISLALEKISSKGETALPSPVFQKSLLPLLTLPLSPMDSVPMGRILSIWACHLTPETADFLYSHNGVSALSSLVEAADAAVSIGAEGLLKAVIRLGKPNFSSFFALAESPSSRLQPLGAEALARFSNASAPQPFFESEAHVRRLIDLLRRRKDPKLLEALSNFCGSRGLQPVLLGWETLPLLLSLLRGSDSTPDIQRHAMRGVFSLATGSRESKIKIVGELSNELEGLGELDPVVRAYINMLVKL